MSNCQGQGLQASHPVDHEDITRWPQGLPWPQDLRWARKRKIEAGVWNASSLAVAQVAGHGGWGLCELCEYCRSKCRCLSTWGNKCFGSICHVSMQRNVVHRAKPIICSFWNAVIASCSLQKPNNLHWWSTLSRSTYCDLPKGLQLIPTTQRFPIGWPIPIFLPMVP